MALMNVSTDHETTAGIEGIFGQKFCLVKRGPEDSL